MAIQITRRDVGDVTVLDPKGKLSGEAGLTLSDAVETVIQDGRQQILLNLGDVSFADRGCLGTLLSLRGVVAKPVTPITA
jgi:anti-anti-sigma factor